MSSFLQTFTPARWAGMLLILLGIIAVFAGSPYRGSTATLDTRELAALVQSEVDHVTPEELAGWIVQGRADFRLMDLRDEAAFQQYHIPGAERVPLTSLTDHGLARNEKIILYSEGGIHSAQAWLLLKANDYKGVYMLQGGLDEWKEKVLFPRLEADATPEQQKAFEKSREVSKFFGGTPQAGATPEPTRPSIALPQPTLPSAAAATPAASSPKKKKKEGC